MLQLAAASSERVFEFLEEKEEDQTVEHPVSVEGLHGMYSLKMFISDTIRKDHH